MTDQAKTGFCSMVADWFRHPISFAVMSLVVIAGLVVGFLVRPIESAKTIIEFFRWLRNPA